MKSRAGATDYGRIYEQKMAALLAIRCALDPTVANFWMVSNVDGFGAFDDIVISIEMSNGLKKLYCIQLKHVENGYLQTNQLTSDKGNFSLDKYYKSYKTIKTNINEFQMIDVEFDEIDFLIYTNVPLFRKSHIDTIKLEKKDCFELINTSSSFDDVIQVTNLDSENLFEESFLRQFSIYTNQAPATVLDRLIKNEIDFYFKGISNTVIVTITDYFLKWSLGKDNKIKRMFKKDIQTKLVECLLQPYIIQPNYYIEWEKKKCKLLNDTLIDFNVTPIFYKKSLGNIISSVTYILQETYNIPLTSETSWNINLTQEQYRLLKTGQNKKIQHVRSVLEEKQQLVAHLTILDLYLSAWQCNLVPLLVNCELCQNLVEEILCKFEEVTKDMSFVLCVSEGIKQFTENLRVFNNFNDIGDTNLLLENLENTYVSLQGKDTLSLKEFVNNVDVLGEITPDVYVMALKEVLKIGEPCELDNYYIKRAVQRPRLRYDVLDISNVFRWRELDQNHHGDIFIVVEFSGLEYIPFKYDNNMMDLAIYLQKYTSGKVSEGKYILTTNLRHTDEVIAESIVSIQMKTNKSVHVVKLRKYYLQWLFSKGPVEALLDYMDKSIPGNSDQIEEDEMLDTCISETNIISNNAGMGKTFMLKSLATKFESKIWVCFMNLSEHMAKVAEIKHPTKYFEYVVHYQTEMNHEIIGKFSREVFRDRCNSGNIVWLLDGYDEVSPNETLPFLQYIKGSNMKIWITTRPTCKMTLERALETVSLEITHFRNDDQVQFVWKYFEAFSGVYDYNKEEIQEIVSTISQYSNSLDETLISIPLQTRMLTEIFSDDISQINEKLTLIELYNKFVDVKLKEYKSYEATSLRKTLSKLALKLFFTADQLEELLDFEELAEEAVTFQESYRKDSIVIGLNERGDAVFGHRSFAEFLTAQWLTKRIISKKGNFNENWKLLVEKLFYVDIISVRAFFDRILCQNLPLHLAVLNNDIESINNFLLKQELRKSDLDCLGRSALHLAVSYGKYYDLNVYTEISGLRSVGLHTYIQEFTDGCILEVPIIKTEHQVSTQIIDDLLRHGVLNTYDRLFSYDAFDYAMKSCSLDALDCLYKTLEKDDLLFEPRFNFKVFLYCLTWDNLYNILSYRKKYNFDSLDFHPKLRNMFVGYNKRLLKIKYNDFYLTELAAYMGSKETLFELLQTNQLSVEDGFPVHKASFSGYSEVVDLLFKLGADIETKDKLGWNPTQIHFLKSNQNVRTDITFQFFKDKKYDSKVTSMTPMHYACQRNHLECVKKLLELGASVVEIDAYGNSPLYYASLYGYVDCVKVMMDALSGEEREDKRVQSVLNTLASKGYSIKSLHNCGLNVNNIDEDGDTPLVSASKNGFPNVIRELVEFQNCDLNLMKSNESLKNICERPILNTVERLINWALNINDDDQNASLSTSKNFSSMVDELMQISLANADQKLMQTRKIELFNYFLKFLSLGVDGDQKTNGGMTALHFAAIEGHLDCVKALIEVGADQDIEDTVGLGYSPIIWAAMKGYSDIVEVLSCTKTNPESYQRRVEDAEIALIWASILGFDACVTVLLKEFTTVNNIQSSRNEARVEDILRREYGRFSDEASQFASITNIPLIVATINKRTSVIQLLTSANYKCNQDLNVALFWALKQGDLKSIEVLVKSGAEENVSIGNDLKVLPVVWASMYGHSEVVKYFLYNKSEEYVKSSDVSLALNFAAAKGHYTCVKLLLDVGVNINNTSSELMDGTPLLNACQYDGTPEIIEELLSRNCDTDVRNKEGMTPLDFIAGKRLFDLVKKVLDMGVHQNHIVDENSVLFGDLQEALDWAMDNEEHGMIYRLMEMGIRRKDGQL